MGDGRDLKKSLEIESKKGDVMKKMLVSLFTLVALGFGIHQASFAACPCQQSEPCPCAKPCNPCDCKQPCGEAWLCPQAIEDYLCRIGLNECQKVEARSAIETFKCETSTIRAKNCKCESKCDCRTYRKALKKLDCSMKNIITKCQKADYNSVKSEIKSEVKCCHKCLINPFNRCKCSCK